MKKLTILCAGALLCLNFCAIGQKISALKLGDKLPEAFWQQEYATYKNGIAFKQNLAAYRGRLLILDFWATWCSTCYHSLPFLDSIAKAEKDKMGVLMVNTIKTKDDLAKIKSSLSKFSAGKPFDLATLYGDDYLLKLFPHGMLSHYVWINVEGQVIAITGSDFVNPTSIARSIKRFDNP